MVEVVVGSTEAFNADIYGAPNRSIYSFIEHNAANASQHLTSSAQSFFSGLSGIYNRVSMNDALRRSRELGRAIGDVWERAGIRALKTMEQLQYANIEMQRWVMAEPTIRKIYHQQSCDGYSDTYIDVHPGRVGVDHIDYRTATDGLVTLNDVTGWEATTYTDQPVGPDQELTYDDKLEIQQTWDWVKDACERMLDDPTSKLKNPL